METQVRKWAEKYDDIYIVSGPVLDGKCVATFAKNICAPAKLFKVVMARFNQELIAIGFLMPQGFSQTDIKKYAVSVDKVEAATGIDFFPAVPADTQERIESFDDFSAWH